MKKAKQILAFVLATVMLCGVFALGASAATSGDWEYTLIDGEIRIDKYKGSGSTVTIPDTIEGSPVTKIGEKTFEGCAALTSVHIPASVTTIDDTAFYHCKSLSSIQVAGGSQHFSSANGVLYNKDYTYLLRYPPAKTGKRYIVAALVASQSQINKYAFEDFDNVSELLSVHVNFMLEKGIENSFIEHGKQLIICSETNDDFLLSIKPNKQYQQYRRIIPNANLLTACQCNGSRHGYDTANMTDKDYFKLWGKVTHWEKTTINWIFCIFLGGWLWMNKFYPV